MEEEEKEEYDSGTHWFDKFLCAPRTIYSFYIKQSLEDIQRLETHDYSSFIPWLLSYRTNSYFLSLTHNNLLFSAVWHSRKSYISKSIKLPV